jgi:alpha-mannosidase
LSLIFHLIPHTHWDREWHLSAATLQARLVPMMDELLDVLNQDATVRSFLLDGQTVLVEDYLRARPDREAELKTLVRTGRLQVGPWYVLADEQIPSGESLIRNLLYGTADAERLGGRSDVLYSPDAFGHPPEMPTLAREFAIKHGVLWRGLGGERGQDRDLYKWKAPDGKELLIWHLPPQGYESGAALAADRQSLPAAWASVRAVLAARAAGRHVPVFVGADHHALHPAIGKLRDLLAEIEPGSAFRVSRLDEFFQAAGESARPATITGELRWSYRYTWTLQGTHGTRLPAKRRHSRAELWLERYAEPLAALARKHGGRDRRPLLETAWRTLLRCAFHDSICGTTNDAAARRIASRHDAVESSCREIVRGAVHELTGYDADAVRDQSEPPDAGTLVLWNPAARARGGITIVDVTFFRRDLLVGPPAPGRLPREGPGYRPFALAAGATRPLGMQVLDRGTGWDRIDAFRHYPDQDEVDVVRVAIRAPTVAGLGMTPLGVTEASKAASDASGGATVRARSVLSRELEVTLEATGALALLDKHRGQWFFGLLRLEDSGDAGDAYSFCPAAPERMGRTEGPIRVRRLAAGPLVAAIEARYLVRAGRGAVAVRLVLSMQADSPVVRCALELDNQAQDHRLRARFPLGLEGARAVAGTQFGALARAPVTVDPAQFPLETPVRTAPAHRFVAAADGNRGLAILFPGFAEYEWTPQGDCVVTLLRAIGQLSRGDLPTRPGHAAWPTAIPAAQCGGRQRVEFGIATVTAADIERGDVIPALWEDVFLPVRGFWLRGMTDLKPAPGSMTLEGQGLVLSSVKPAQVGSAVVLRCYNATDRAAQGAWRFGEAVRSAHRVRADEKESTALVLEEKGKLVRFTAAPRELVTLIVT